MNIELDLQIVIDDVPIGLSLQNLTPFKFQCHKLWMRPVSEVTLPMEKVNQVIYVNVSYMEEVNQVIYVNVSSWRMSIE